MHFSPSSRRKMTSTKFLFYLITYSLSECHYMDIYTNSTLSFNNKYIKKRRS